jgi:adenylate cyclase
MVFLRELRRAGQTTDIELKPLTPAETITLAAHLADRLIDAEATTRLYRYTEGNPLYIMETMRASNWRETIGRAELDDFPPTANRYALPAKIHAVIQHRLTQLAHPARELVYLAAVLGRAFTFNLLVQASGKDENTVMQGVDELWRRGIVRQQGIHCYDFSHGRIREVAYTEIGPVQRALLHQRVADALAQQHAEDIDAVSAQLAMHYAQAGEPEQAIGYHQRAARVANDRFAYAETVEHLTRAVALLEQLPDTRSIQERELSILLQVLEPLTMAKGWSTPEQGPILTRAMALCQQVGTKQQHYAVLDGWRRFHQMRADLVETLHYAKQIVSLAEELENEGAPEKISWSHFVLGIVLLHLGELKAARTHMERAHADPHLFGPTYRLMLLFWLLGYPDRAQGLIEELFANTENAPHRMAIMHSFAARLECCLYRPTSVRERAERLLALATKYTLPFWLALGTLLRGWSRVEEGETEPGIADLQRGITALAEAHFLQDHTFYLGLLAEAHAKAGHYREALTVLDDAFNFLKKSGERYWQAELVRLRGEFLLAQGVSAHEVEACYRRSLDIARRQSAKSLELRASLSLSRLWQQQGKYKEAHTLLAGIYGGFTEGFDTADLIEAKVLLQTLSNPWNPRGRSHVVGHAKL